jgi:hypothetical protein
MVLFANEKIMRDMDLDYGWQLWSRHSPEWKNVPNYVVASLLKNGPG